MPSTGPGVHKKAKREGWESRKQKGVQGSGVEYYVDFYQSPSRVKRANGVAEPDNTASYNEPAKDKTISIAGYCRDDEEMENATIWQVLAEKFVIIPGYTLPVSASDDSINTENTKTSRFLAFSKKWLEWRGFNKKDLTIVWAEGDSMEPTIHNNDTLVVNVGRNKPSDGHIYIFRKGDELFAKRFQNALDCWLLISDNPRYETIPIPHDKQSQYDVVGQVVHVGKDIGDYNLNV
ncbi:XRE family transcriptional regulator [Vibrio parahaemolyticus]|nr:XRE family transcriptional regulator [Vibrio parahaemolyticus]